MLNDATLARLVARANTITRIEAQAWHTNPGCQSGAPAPMSEGPAIAVVLAALIARAEAEVE